MIASSSHNEILNLWKEFDFCENLWPRTAVQRCSQEMADKNKPPSGKLAILIGNCSYKKTSNWADLEGAKRDLEAMKQKLSASGYQIEVIKNSSDILGDIEDVMKKTEAQSVTHLQVHYVGEKILYKVWIFRSSLCISRSWRLQGRGEGGKADRIN